MTDLRSIYKEQLKFVDKIVVDILKHKASPEIIEHAKGYAHLENDYGDFWRVSFGEACAYIDIDKNGETTGNVFWNNDEMGVENGDSYIGTLADLEKMTAKEIYERSSYSNCYDNVGEYELPYESM